MVGHELLRECHFKKANRRDVSLPQIYEKGCGGCGIQKPEGMEFKHTGLWFLEPHAHLCLYIYTVLGKRPVEDTSLSLGHSEMECLVTNV